MDSGSRLSHYCYYCYFSSLELPTHATRPMHVPHPADIVSKRELPGVFVWKLSRCFRLFVLL